MISHGPENPSVPALRLAAITPDDDNDLPSICRGIYVGGEGDIALIAAGDSSAVTLVGVLAGTVLPIQARRVLETGTTATNLVALY